jgi:hypothetical protein
MVIFQSNVSAILSIVNNLLGSFYCEWTWREMRRWNWHFLFRNESFGSHIHRRCICPWGEDYALRTLDQVVANNLIPPCLDILVDPIRIWNWLLVYWIFDNTIVIIIIISIYMNITTLKTKHIQHTFFNDSNVPKIIN